MNCCQILTTSALILVTSVGLAQEAKPKSSSEKIVWAQDLWNRQYEFLGKWVGTMTQKDKPASTAITVTVQSANFESIAIAAETDNHDKLALEIQSHHFCVPFTQIVFAGEAIHTWPGGDLPGLKQDKAQLKVNYSDRTLTIAVTGNGNDSNAPDYKFVLQRPAP